MRRIKKLIFVLVMTSVNAFAVDCDEDDSQTESVMGSRSVGGFYDFDTRRKTLATKEGGWSANAPAWRRWSWGANLEGYCHNPACPAHFKKVISPLGLGSFFIVKDGKYTKEFLCPVCDKPMIPRTCGFTGCHYRMKGRKADKALLARPWETKGTDGYILFDEETQGLAEFIDIKIETKSLGQSKPDDDEF